MFSLHEVDGGGVIDGHDGCEWWMFLLVPTHMGSPRQNPESHKMVAVVVVVVVYKSNKWIPRKPQTLMSAPERSSFAIT